MLVISFLKISSYYLLKGYRKYYKGNLRSVVIFGNCNRAIYLKNLIQSDLSLGYNLKAIFSNKKKDNISGSVAEGLDLLKTHLSIDEIYCSTSELTDLEERQLLEIANNYEINIKFIVEDNYLFPKRFNVDYYGLLPMVSNREFSLNSPLNKLIKRGFDIFFSLIVMVGILSWLVPILYILMQLDSKGPLFYKHLRNGINYKEFECYKFRSLIEGHESKDDYVKPEDKRLTRIGKFIRRTSIDELPQFINVFFGDMSVVGPRPHMPYFTSKYSKVIDKYNFNYRHNVKPGITGLAQIKGYRGEIKSREDIINRIKYDIFYIENWSLFFDVKIVLQTIINLFKGEDKAY